jgi:CRISPR system Cascade subunit CasB
MSETVAAAAAVTEQPHDERFIGYLESVLKRDDRAILANLRRGLGRAPGTAMEMFPYVARFTSALHPKDEDSFFLVASLFGLYPTPGWRKDEAQQNNLGHSLSLLKAQSESTERRFVALLNSTREDLPEHLRQIISLLKSKEAPVNWVQLLRDIRNWDRSERWVQRNWAKGFWGNVKNQNSDEGEKQQ